MVCYTFVMGKIEQPEGENFVEIMREIVAKSRSGIKEEFSRTANSWLACFAGHLDALDAYLSLADNKGQFSSEEYKKLSGKIEKLKEQVHSLRPLYPDKNTIPPEALQEELLKAFDIFQ